MKNPNNGWETGPKKIAIDAGRKDGINSAIPIVLVIIIIAIFLAIIF